MAKPRGPKNNLFGGRGYTPPKSTQAPAATPAAPARPAAVTPFWTADDLTAINGFNTDYGQRLADIDFNLGNLETDTTYQTGQVNSGAKQSTANTQDDAAARGIFQSSVKDAAVYDIEAQRALQTKFLGDKLTSARLKAGTDKKILTDSKTEFDKAMLLKQGENAQGANDAASAGWADAQAAWEAANPAKGITPGYGPAATPKPSPKKPAASSNRAAYQSSQASTSTSAAAASARARAKPKKKR